MRNMGPKTLTPPLSVFALKTRSSAVEALRGYHAGS
jgi:hypothetical protein